MKKIIYPNTHSSEAYVKYLRRKGISVGEFNEFISPKNTYIDVTKPNFLSIGSHCTITSGVTVLAHDWSYSIMIKKYNDIVGKQLYTTIGNNVFIGMNSIILMGASIGDNVIIGAGSVVIGKVDSNSVYAGNPAKKICTLEAHYEKCKNSYIDGARNHALEFIKRNERLPSINEMDLYRPLFIEKNEENMIKYFSNVNDYTRKAMSVMPQKFKSVEEFINNRID